MDALSVTCLMHKCLDPFTFMAHARNRSKQHSMGKWLCYSTPQEHRKLPWAPAALLHVHLVWETNIDLQKWISECKYNGAVVIFLKCTLTDFFSLEAPKLTHSLSFSLPLFSWILVCTYQVFIRIIGWAENVTSELFFGEQFFMRV